MQAFIEAKREQIAELCRTHHVRRLSVFGSAARDDFDYAPYEDDRMVRAAVERKFEIIGEALAQMRQHYPAFMQKIGESRKIINFRNYLIHQYSTVDNEAVWSAVQWKLSAFRAQVDQLKAEVAVMPEAP